jgi:hypothetical protein
MELSPYVHREHHYELAAFVTLRRETGHSLQDAEKWEPLPMDAAKLEALIPYRASINAIARPTSRS